MSAAAASSSEETKRPPRSLVSLADFGSPDELARLVEAVRRNAPEVPAPTEGKEAAALCLTTSPSALGAPAWLAELERAGWSFVENTASSQATLELVYTAHFAPRRSVADKRATRWSRLAREDPLTKPSASARLNLGGVVHDPLGALAALACAAESTALLRSRPIALVWTGATTSSGAPAPVAWVHSLLEGLALLGESDLLVAQPEGFELYPAVLAAAECQALATNPQRRVEAAYTPEQTHRWLAAHPNALTLPATWYPLRYYDDQDAGNAATNAATPHAWQAATGIKTTTLTPQPYECAALAAALAWCLQR